MKSSYLTTTCISVVLLTACGPTGGSQDVASGPSASPSATSVVTSPSPSATSASSPSPSPQGAEDGECREAASYEETAGCLYDAFLAQDQQEASRYATSEAVEALFAMSDYKPDQWTFHGCDDSGDFYYKPAKVCHFQIPYEVHPTYVQLAMSSSYKVEQVQTIG